MHLEAHSEGTLDLEYLTGEADIVHYSGDEARTVRLGLILRIQVTLQTVVRV